MHIWRRIVNAGYEVPPLVMLLERIFVLPLDWVGEPEMRRRTLIVRKNKKLYAFLVYNWPQELNKLWRAHLDTKIYDEGK